MPHMARASCQSNRSGPSTLFPKPGNLPKPTQSCLYHFSPHLTTRTSFSKNLRGPTSNNQHAAGHVSEMGTVVQGPTFVHPGPTHGREGMLRGGGRGKRGGRGGHLEGEGGAGRGVRAGAGRWVRALGCGGWRWSGARGEGGVEEGRESRRVTKSVRSCGSQGSDSQKCDFRHVCPRGTSSNRDSSSRSIPTGGYRVKFR